MAYNLDKAAKLLGVGRNTLFRMLRHHGVLGKDNLPKQSYINRGLFKVSHRSFVHPVVGIKHYGKTLVTDAGIRWLAKEFRLCDANSADADQTPAA